jgi:hypothetical protein
LKVSISSCLSCGWWLLSQSPSPPPLLIPPKLSSETLGLKAKSVTQHIQVTNLFKVSYFCTSPYMDLTTKRIEHYKHLEDIRTNHCHNILSTKTPNCLVISLAAKCCFKLSSLHISFYQLLLRTVEYKPM